MSCFDFHSMSKLTIEWVELVVNAANQLDHSCKILTVKNTNTPFRGVFLGRVAVLIAFNLLKSFSARVLNLKPDDWKII